MKKIAFLLLIVGLSFGCRKEPNLSNLSDDFLVATFYDEEAIFTDYVTYKIVDKVGIISNDPNSDTVLSTTIGNQLINRVKSNMNSRGYVNFPLDTSADADLGINIFTIKELSEGNVISPGYWWGYPGYYDPYYWGCFDCYYYYPYSYSYSYNTGTVIIEIMDLKNVDANNDKVRVIWTGLGNGLLSDYISVDLQYALNSIDQAFIQSPYIQR
ncbi:MAG: hypothetical protein RIQ47_1673 [Bacteroidota bacterium]|jgi:hypothetical protein